MAERSRVRDLYSLPEVVGALVLAAVMGGFVMTIAGGDAAAVMVGAVAFVGFMVLLLVLPFGALRALEWMEARRA